MNILFAIILFLHGCIHLFGFLKAFGYAEMRALSVSISKAIGIFWLLAFVLFELSSLLFLLQQSQWIWIAGAGIVISQFLILNYWQHSKFGTLANVLILLVCIVKWNTLNFYQQYQNTVSAEKIAYEKAATEILGEQDIEHLPKPVQKYLRYTGSVGKPKVRNFKLTFKGRIRKSEESEWMNFTSEQYNFISQTSRLFFMNATMKHLPVAGFHCYQNGKAFMDIRVLSLLKVQNMAGPNMDTAETVTFFNDMCCMAPSTLIDERIRWLKTIGNRVDATFTSNHICIQATLFFNDTGQLINFISEDRFAADAGRKLPWSTPLKNYKRINNFQLAGDAETIYHYPEKELCYGEFQLKQVEYNIGN